MNLDDRLDVVKLFYKSGESATLTLRAFKKLRNLKKDPFSTTAITNLINKFNETKSLHDIPKSGRPSLIDERKEEVVSTMGKLQAENVLGHASSHSVSKICKIPQRSVCRVLHTCGMNPYKISLLQSITEEDKTKRLEFSKWVLANPELIHDIVWTDEAYFSLDGLVNRHNCVIWSFQNPHRYMQKSLHPLKVCVWMGFSARYKLTPVFFDGTVDRENYTNLLKNSVFPELRRKRKMRSVIFQHDGAPPHFSVLARDFISNQLPENRVIGRGYGVPWPPRSPDLSPLDFYLWGTLKARVFHSYQANNLEDLKQRIIEEINELSVDELCRSVENLQKRCEMVIANDGGSIEHLM